MTLGASCRYAVAGDPDSIILTDPGASRHVSSLGQRFVGFKLDIRNVRHVLMTHMDADRVAGIPLLRRLAPKMELHGSAAMHTFLLQEKNVEKLWEKDLEISKLLDTKGADAPLTFTEFKAGLKIDRHLVEAETIYSGEELGIRAVFTPGHRSHSVAYAVLPYKFIVADESFGYFNGNKLAAPGADLSLQSALTSMQKFDDMDASGIGFPYLGAVTGALVRKHLDGVRQNTLDIIAETRSAFEAGFGVDEIRAQIRESFYLPSTKDPLMIQSMLSSFEGVWHQLASLRTDSVKKDRD